MSTSTKAIAENLPASKKELPDNEINTYPFRRLFARTSDLMLLGYLPGQAILLGIWYVYPQIATVSMGQLVLLCIVVMHTAAVILSALCLSQFSNTPAKAVFGIKVKSEKGRISFFDALTREMIVYIKGLALGIPFLWLLTALYQCRKLKLNGKTSWDRACNLDVVHTRWVFIRPALAILLTGFSLAAFKFSNAAITLFAQ